MTNRTLWSVLIFLLVSLLGCTSSEQQAPASSESEAATTESPETSAEEALQLTGAALAAALQDEDVFLLDVRNPDELEEYGTVEGYVNIPIDQLAERLSELPRDKPILTA